MEKKTNSMYYHGRKTDSMCYHGKKRDRMCYQGKKTDSMCYHPSKHSSWWRRLEDVFSVTFFCLPRRLEDVLKMSWRHNCKTSWRRLRRRLEDLLEDVLQDVLKTFQEDVLQIRLEDVFKTSSRGLGRRKVLRCVTLLEDVLENKKCLLGNTS